MAAYAALRSLAQITHPNTSQYKSFFSSDAEEKVRSIHDYVNFLILFFEDCPDKVNRWEGRIRNLAFKIEDIIETFICQRVQHHPAFFKFEGQLENVMEEIGLIAGEVLEERPAYLPPSSSSSSSTLASTGNDAVIGLEGDIMAIKDRLCGLSSDLQFIPIVGMGGIGKTTLARSVYDDPLIIKHFDFCAWVVVSQDYSPHRLRKILLDLLDSMKLLELQMCRDEIDASEIALKVFKYLKGRRYLVVIDDVWGTQFWDDVRFIFPDDNNGSRIVFTTRQLDVAAYPYSAGHLHEMQFMNDSASWDLLRQNVFENGCCPPDLEGVGKEIAQRCAGLPLALVLIGGVLSQVNATRAFWEEIAKNVNLVFGHELKEIILLSYTYLPHHLRPCFLFIGGFLEDAKIHASRLIRLWVAEGFLKHQDGCSKSLEDVAEEYLEELVKRNLLIVNSRKSNGKIKSCSLHDLVRDLCKRIAMEDKFLHVMDGCDLPQGLINERRMICSNVVTIWGPTIRTILCFQIKNFPGLLALLGSYKLLRVLEALGEDLNEFPSEVFELHHLRYLALMGSFSIPSLLSNLVNLQTLVIHLMSGKQRRHKKGLRHSLPVEIWRLQQLRHIFLHAPYMLPHPPEGLNLPLENLQTLLLVANLEWNEKILQMVPNVKRLGLTYTSNQEFHLHHLKDMHQLEKLEVIGYTGFSWRWQNPSFPSTLKKLTLLGGGFPWKDMAIVGSLPNLEILKLLGNACDGERWETTDEDFPRLKVLLIDESRLQRWVTQSNPLPALKRLVLRSCWYLREIPENIGEIPTLELIDVYCCTNSLLDSAMKIKEDQESYGNYALQVQAAIESSLHLRNSAKEPEPDEEEEAEAGAQRRLWVKARWTAWWEQVSSPDYPDEEFRKAFRMGRATFDMICSELESVVTKKDTMLRLAIPVRQRVAVCVWRLATGEAHREVSKRFGLGMATCHKLVLEVCTAISTVLMPKFLRWPCPDRMPEVKRGFEALSAIPDVGGAIYTTHIPVTLPLVQAAAYFYKRQTERNQKTTFSIMLQGVVDHTGVFTDICVGWRGSMTHDLLLHKSTLFRHAAATWIVGNSAFPLMDWLLVPYAHQNLTWAQHAFNEKVAEVQGVATEAFMRLKARWTYLQKHTEMMLDDFPVVLEACCVLHNICEMRGEGFAPEMRFHLFDDQIVPKNPLRSHQALLARDQIAHKLLHHNLAGTNFQ